MFQRSDLCAKILHSMIEIIGRRTSQDYALVMVYSAAKSLEVRYPFFQAVTIQNVRFGEDDRYVAVGTAINTADQTQIGAGVQELISSIVTSMGTRAGFFFMKELKDRIGPMYTQEINDIGIDLDFLQAQLSFDRQQEQTFPRDQKDVVLRIFKALIEILEADASKSDAIQLIKKLLVNHYDDNPWLKYISFVNVRIVQGVEDVLIAPELLSVDVNQMGKTIDMILDELRTQLASKGGSNFYDEFRKKFTNEYLHYMQEIGINLKRHQASNDAVFKEVIRAVLDVLGKASSQQYAIFTMNNFLRKIETRFSFLKFINVVPSQSSVTPYDIMIMENLEEISDTDTRRSIQKLLEEICHCLGATLRKQFIDEFKSALDPNFLKRIEEMGINLHMIQLKQELF
jgi:hypothetical protein